MLSLQLLRQPRYLQHLGIKPLIRQIHQREIHRMRRSDVFGSNASALHPDGRGQCRLGLVNRHPLPCILRQLKTLIGFHGKLGVHRQIDRLIPGPARQNDGVFHPLLAAGADSRVGFILPFDQHIAKQRAQLHLTPGPAGLDV
ncbi:hypothetical protein SDC9_151781 [bioreactor metagenome]|uniref:Uncharacterized protein n=1 Tax=bioreactor metagenome TaxID=1076179 RepID=A0A645ESZ8_9ZZZZ